MGGGSAPTSAGGLQERLLARRDEIEAAVSTRVYAVSDPTEAADPTYVEGLKTAVSAAIDYGLQGIAASPRNLPPLPPALLVQARIAARAGVGLDTVLRRYFAGYALLGDFLIEEAEATELQGAALKPLLRAQAQVFDRLVAAVSEEHAREAKARLPTSENRKAELIEGLLDGERLDASELAYGFDGHHVAIVGRGTGAEEAVRGLAGGLDRRLLILKRAEGTTWAWLGGTRPPNPEELRSLTASTFPGEVALAIGEPAKGLEGWRLTHRQAQAALPIAIHQRKWVHYADVALLSSVLNDELLTSSLEMIFLTPLSEDRDEGKNARETLRAYFQAGRNVSSTAAALKVSRQTVANRLRVIEGILGRLIDSHAIEIEIAILLNEER